jgi:hypothetical protein
MKKEEKNEVLAYLYKRLKIINREFFLVEEHDIWSWGHEDAAKEIKKILRLIMLVRTNFYK